MVEKLDYNYKTDFESWKENKEFECLKNSSYQPPWDSTPVLTKMLDAKLPPLISTPTVVQMSDPKTPTTDLSKRKEKAQK